MTAKSSNGSRRTPKTNARLRKLSPGPLIRTSGAPSDVEGREYFNGIHAKIAPKREDIATWFDVLDVDDYVSYGGKA